MSVPVLFVLLPNVLMLDLAGPAEVLRLAAQSEDPAALDFDLQYVSPVPSCKPRLACRWPAWRLCRQAWRPARWWCWSAPRQR